MLIPVPALIILCTCQFRAMCVPCPFRPYLFIFCACQFRAICVPCPFRPYLFILCTCRVKFRAMYVPCPFRPYLLVLLRVLKFFCVPPATQKLGGGVGEVILRSIIFRVVLVKPYCNPVNGSVQCLVDILYGVRYRTPLLEYRLRE